MNDIVPALFMWINLHTTMIPPEEFPVIVHTEPGNACMQFGINNKKQCKLQKLVAFYNTRDTIYLRHDFNYDNPVDVSVLLHELIHYVQWKNGRASHCRGILESQAYKLQDKWLQQRNLQARSDAFSVLMLEAACEDA